MSFDVRTGDFDRAGRESKEAPARPVRDWTIWAILTMLFCGCMPIGLLGLNYAMQAKAKLKVGDWREAEKLAEKAKICVYFSISWGLGTIFVGVGLFMFGFVMTLIEAAIAAQEQQTMGP